MFTNDPKPKSQHAGIAISVIIGTTFVGTVTHRQCESMPSIVDSIRHLLGLSSDWNVEVRS